MLRVKASLQRKILRWIHIILSIPIVGYVYGPVSKISRAAFAVRWIFFPIVVISGLWMWKGHLLRRRRTRRQVIK
jgi:thiosulfate reductase cytochrome b subunit